MAAAISSQSNFYVQIKNKSLKLKDRLQLLRYCWKSTDLYFPNKEQVLLDVLTGILINKKNENLSTSEVTLVWGCLQQILQTKKATEPGRILLKQSTVQLLTDSVSKVDSSCDYIQSLIGCLYAVLGSDSMSTVFTAKLDTMVTVLNGLCVLQGMVLVSDDSVFSLLVTTTVDRFLVALETAPDQNQILQKMGVTFLPKFIPLWNVNPSHNVKKLSSALLASICHRDHIQNFDGYLKASHSGSGSHVHRKAKPVEQLFSSLASLFKLHPSQCSLYVPIIFDMFMQQNCHNGINLVAHYLFVEICTLVGVCKENNNTNRTVDDSHVFTTINKLLEVVKTRELYDTDIDEKNSHLQIQFYRLIIQVLVNCRQMTADCDKTRSYSDWYGCFTTLLQINHHILEPKLQDLLAVGWINTKVQDEDINALDILLCEFIGIYSKLRQIPKLIAKILSSLCTCEDDTVLQIPPMFLKRYGEMIQSLPQGMMIDILKKFTAILKTHFVDAEESGNFQGVCTLFHHYLLNVKVADYSVTEMTLQSACDLINLMETDIFVPTLNKYLKQSQVDCQRLAYLLHLCEAWGEVVMMLSFYSKSGRSLQEKPLASEIQDLSYVHSYLSMKQWRKLHSITQMEKNTSLQFIWDILTMQKIRSVLIFKNMEDWLSQVNTLTTMINYLSDIDVSKVTSWSGKFEDITDTNLAVGRWSLFTRYMSALSNMLSEEHLNIIAAFTMNCLSILNPGPDVTLHSISMKFLSSDVVRENSNLLSSIITGIWSTCSQCFNTRKQGSAKKKKSSTLLTSVNSLMSLLAEPQYAWSTTDKSEVLKKKTEVSDLLSSIHVSKDSVHVDDTETLNTCVKLLQGLPLDKIQSCDQIKCLVSVLAIKCLSEKNGWEAKDVGTVCVELCTVIMESSNAEQLFEMISMDMYLSWLHSVLNSDDMQSVEYHKCVLLAETSCQMIVKDFGVLEDLKKFAQKLKPGEPKSPDVGALNLMSFLIQETGKLLNRPYLKESLKTGYTELFLSMTKSAMKMQSLMKSPDATHEKCILVRIYTTVISLLNVDEDLKKEFLEKFGDVVTWCENVVKEMMSSDVYAVMSALMFFQSLYKNHTQLQDLVNAETKWTTWEMLVIALRQIVADTSASLLDMSSASNGRGHSEVKQTDNNSAVKSMSSLPLKSNFENVRNILEGSGEVCSHNSNKNKMEVELSPCSHSDSMPTNSADNVNQGSIHTSFRSLIFTGELEKQRSNIVTMQVQSSMATLLVSFDLELFQKVTQSLINDVHPDSLVKDKLQIQSALLIWKYLLTMNLTDELSKAIKHSAKDMMLNMHGLCHALQYSVSDDLMRDIVIPVLRVQNQMLSVGKNQLLTSRSSVLSLHCCLYTPLIGRNYFPAFHSMYEILDTLLVHHTDTVFLNIPAFTQCCKTLLISVVEQSNQDLISQKPDIIKQLTTCAYQMERLFSLIATHKIEFSKVAVYIIADYLTAVQKLTMLPAIKRALIPAIHKMLDLCDRHTISQLHVVLNQGVTEVFKLLYSEYKKFHKYQGKI